MSETILFLIPEDGKAVAEQLEEFVKEHKMQVCVWQNHIMFILFKIHLWIGSINVKFHMNSRYKQNIYLINYENCYECTIQTTSTLSTKKYNEVVMTIIVKHFPIRDCCINFSSLFSLLICNLVGCFCWYTYMIYTFLKNVNGLFNKKSSITWFVG